MKKAFSAGGIVTKGEGNNILVCLVKLTPPMEGWVFPKGHIEENETPEQAALREVEEEVGLPDLEIIEKIGIVTRPSVEDDGTVVQKDIHLFLMRSKNNQHLEAEEEYQWFSVDQTLAKLSFPQERKFFDENRERVIGKN